MTHADLYEFLNSHRWAVQASVNPDHGPQAALVGFAVTPELEPVFDTLDTTRKVLNLRENQKIGFVIGGWLDRDERTVQYEGIADFPTGEALERLKEVYFAKFPEGREGLAWQGLIYVRTRPSWIRYSNFNNAPPEINEFSFPSA